MNSIPTPILHTGISELDLFLPDGGIRAGNIVEVSGEERSGKTSLTALFVNAILRQGEYNVFYFENYEHLSSHFLYNQCSQYKNFFHIVENDIDKIFAYIKRNCHANQKNIFIIDDINAFCSDYKQYSQSLVTFFRSIKYKLFPYSLLFVVNNIFYAEGRYGRFDTILADYHFQGYAKLRFKIQNDGILPIDACVSHGFKAKISVLNNDTQQIKRISYNILIGKE